MADATHIQNLADSFATFTESVLKLKTADLLNEESITKVKETATHFIAKVHEAITKVEVAIAPPVVQVAAPVAATTQQPVQQQQPVVQTVTPPPAQLYCGYTLMQLKAQNVTVLRDIAISLQGRPNASNSVPVGTGAMEQVFKDQLVQYICDNAQFA